MEELKMDQQRTKYLKILLYLQMTMTVLLLFSLFGCHAPETVIKDKVITITVPAVKDSFPTVIKGVTETQKDTIEKVFAQLPDTARIEAVNIADPGQKIIFYPKSGTVKIKLPEKKVDAHYTDTTAFYQKEIPFAEKSGYLLYGIAIAIGLIGLIYFVVKGLK